MTMTERIADLSVIWKQAALVFPYFDRLEINWDEKYREYIPKVTAAESGRDFHLLLAEFMNILGDGHTCYVFPESVAKEAGYLPFVLKYVGGDYYVGPAAPGGEQHLFSKILSINGRPFRAILREAFRYIYHVGDYAPPNRLGRILPFLLSPSGNVMETEAGTFRFDLEKSKPEFLGGKAMTASMPFRDVSQGKLTARLYENGVLYVKLDDFLHSEAAKEVATALNVSHGLKGVILDLRDNVGGMTMYGAKVAELFISGEFHACKKRARTINGADVSAAGQILGRSEERQKKDMEEGLYDRGKLERCRKIAAYAYFEEYTDRFGKAGRKAIYDGPCVLLTSRDTVSAAEDFAAMFRTNERAKIIGTRTQGTTGTPLIQPLSSGGSARICSVGYELADGTAFIGTGIKPDIFAEPSIEDWIMGKDTVLELALGSFE
ncbi:MAG: S41 family peptidase [Oscillospiraceae bacterium]